MSDNEIQVTDVALQKLRTVNVSSNRNGAFMPWVAFNRQQPVSAIFRPLWTLCGG